MEQNMDAGWELHPIGGDTGQAYMAVRAQERVFLKRNSSPFLAALSGEGIAPKLMWTKRAGNGDVLTAQEWLNGRSLTTEEMNSMEVIDLLKEIHQSPNLLLMLQKIQGEEYTAQHFIEDYLVNLQSGLQSHRFLSEVLDYLKETLPLVLEAGKTVCHGDLDRRNFLLANDKLYLIDWEMVRLADPVSDLTMILTQYIPDEGTMLRFGKKLAEVLVKQPKDNAIVLYFNGDLGAGKTTLTRGMVQGLGYQGNVKSPTYTLVEEYSIAGKMIYHFDLYRLADPEELEFMGIRDYFSQNCICLIEWAEKGEGILPEADLLVNIDYYDDARNITLIAQNSVGEHILTQL